MMCAIALPDALILLSVAFNIFSAIIWGIAISDAIRWAKRAREMNL